MTDPNHLPIIDEEKVVLEWRQGYQPVKHPLPGIALEEITDQPIGRTPYDDLRDETDNA